MFTLFGGDISKIFWRFDTQRVILEKRYLEKIPLLSLYNGRVISCSIFVKFTCGFLVNSVLQYFIDNVFREDIVYFYRYITQVFAITFLGIILLTKLFSNRACLQK